MKNNILLSLVLLLACGSANAINWQPVECQLPNVEVYVDMDSIRKGENDNEFLYAARYKVKNEPEKLIYLRTDTADNKLGVIKVEDFADAEYRPIRNLTTPRAFMKKVRKDFFLKPLHDYIIALSMNDELVKNYDGIYALYSMEKNPTDPNYVNTTYVRKEYEVITEQPVGLDVTTANNPTIFKDEFVSYTNTNNAPNQAVSDYLSLVCKQINASWMPPQTETDRRVAVNASINKNGKLVSYDIVESSGDKRIDNSAIKALQDAQTYPAIPANIIDNKSYSMIFRFVFERTKFGHTVIY